VIGFSKDTLYKNPQTSKIAFRAATAIDRGNGNCIAVHEIVSGTLSKAGLAKRTLGTWSRGHAETHYMIGNKRVDVDGQHKYAEFMHIDSEPEWQPLTAIYRKVLTKNLVAVYNEDEQGYPLLDDLALLKPNEISGLPPDDGTRTYVMQGATATLMYIATEAQKGGEKFEHAAETLQDFAIAA
jgi:hypothetical protein